MRGIGVVKGEYCGATWKFELYDVCPGVAWDWFAAALAGRFWTVLANWACCPEIVGVTELKSALVVAPVSPSANERVIDVFEGRPNSEPGYVNKAPRKSCMATAACPFVVAGI